MEKLKTTLELGFLLANSVELLQPKIEKIQQNQRTCNFLAQKIKAISSIVDKFIEEWGEPQQNYVETIRAACEKATVYVERYSFQTDITRLLSVVTDSKDVEDAVQINEELDEALKGLLGDKNIPTLECNILQQHSTNDLMKFIEAYKSEVTSFIKKQDPISYNPHRSLLLTATTRGKAFGQAETEAFDIALANQDEEALQKMFKLPEDEIEAFDQYVEQYYPNEYINVLTLISEAISCKTQTLLIQYFDEHHDSFLNKVLSIRDTQSMTSSYINGEIQDSSRLSENELKFKLSFDNKTLLHYREIIIKRNTFRKELKITSNKIECINLSTFLKQLNSQITKSVKITLRKGIQTKTTPLKNSFPILPVGDCEMSCYLHNYLSGNVGASKKWKVKFSKKDTFTTISYTFHYDGKNVHYHITRTDVKGDVSKENKIILSLNDLQDYELLLLNENNTREFTVSYDDVEIKGKQLTENEQKLLLSEKYEIKKNELIELFSELETNELDVLMIYLNRKRKFSHCKSHSSDSGLTFNENSEDSLFFTRWLNCLSHDQSIQGVIDELFHLHNLIFPKTHSYSCLVEVAYAATRFRLLKTRTDCRDVIESMDHLATAVDYSEPIRGKDLVAIVGETGSGKSTLCNCFLGANLEYDASNFNRVRIKGQPDHDKKYAEIGVLNGRSHSKYVQPYFIQDNKMKSQFRDKNIDNIVFGDCAGYFDTRGEILDLATSLSLERSFNLCKTLKAIIIVVPEKNFHYGKGRSVIEAFSKLEDLFQTTFDKLSNEVRSRIFMVISHCDKNHKKAGSDIADIVRRFYQESLVSSEKQSSSVSPESPADRMKERIWNLVNNICAERRILVLNIHNIREVSMFLKSSIMNNNSGIPKTSLKSLLDIAPLYKTFSSSIGNSLFVWEHLLFGRYLDLMKKPETILNDIQKYYLKKDEIHQFQLITQASKEQRIQNREEIVKEIAILEEIKLNNTKEEHQKRIEEIRIKANIRREKDIQDKTSQIEKKIIEINSLHISLQDFTLELEALIAALQETAEKVDKLRADLVKLSTGEEKIHIDQVGPFQYDETFYEAKAKGYIEYFKELAYNLLSLKFNLPHSDNLFQIQFGKYTGKRKLILELHLIYRKIENHQLWDLLCGREIRTDKGNYRLNFKNQNQLQILFHERKYPPKTFLDGTSISFPVELTFQGKESKEEWVSPTLTIYHMIPNQDINEEEIKNVKVLLDKINIDLSNDKNKIFLKEIEINDIKSNIGIASKQLINWENDLAELHELNFKEELNELIESQYKSLPKCEEEIELCDQQLKEYTLLLLQYNKKILKKFMNYQLIRFEQYRLATTILYYSNVAENWRKFADQAFHEGSDVSNALNFAASSMSYNSQRIFNACSRFIDFHQTEGDTSSQYSIVMDHADKLIRGDDFDSLLHHYVLQQNQRYGGSETENPKFEENEKDAEGDGEDLSSDSFIDQLREDIPLSNKLILLTSRSNWNLKELKENLLREERLVSALKFNWTLIPLVMSYSYDELLKLDIRDSADPTLGHSSLSDSIFSAKLQILDNLLQEYGCLRSSQRDATEEHFCDAFAKQVELSLQQANSDKSFSLSSHEVINRFASLFIQAFDIQPSFLNSAYKFARSDTNSSDEERMKLEGLTNFILQSLAILYNVTIIVFHATGRKDYPASIWRPATTANDSKTSDVVYFGEIAGNYFSVSLDPTKHVANEKMQKLVSDYGKSIPSFILNFCQLEAN